MTPTPHSDSTEAGWLGVASIDHEAAVGTANHAVERTQVREVEAAQSDPGYRPADPAGADPGNNPEVPARPAPAQPQPDTFQANGPRFFAEIGVPNTLLGVWLFPHFFNRIAAL